MIDMCPKIVTCAICDRTFDIEDEGGFTNKRTGKSVCIDCSKEHQDETVRLMVEIS